MYLTYKIIKLSLLIILLYIISKKYLFNKIGIEIIDKDNYRVHYYNQSITIEISDRIENIIYRSNFLREIIIIPKSLVGTKGLQNEIYKFPISDIMKIIFNRDDRTNIYLVNLNKFKIKKLNRIKNVLMKYI